MSQGALNPRQLKMFMSPKEIHEAGYRPWSGDREFIQQGDHRWTTAGDRSENDTEFWDRKLEEADNDELTDSVEREGVKYPVRLSAGRTPGPYGHGYEKAILGGHHRIAAQMSVDQHRLMPVLHDVDMHSAQTGREYPYR